jgi:hypothetical protein
MRGPLATSDLVEHGTRREPYKRLSFAHVLLAVRAHPVAICHILHFGVCLRLRLVIFILFFLVAVGEDKMPDILAMFAVEFIFKSLIKC